MLNLSREILEKQGGLATAEEILQQPECWEKLAGIVTNTNLTNLQNWTGDPNCRIVLTGAGSSAFVGEILAPYLTKERGRPVEAIATTHIVTTPHDYLLTKQKTLLVSFARSGNSPESVATVELANQIIANVHHLVITCNSTGALAKLASANPQGYTLVLMPPETNDRGFAMTSSVSSMLIAGLLIFQRNQSEFAKLSRQVSELAQLIRTNMAEYARLTTEIAKLKYNRYVVLGSDVFYGLAREGSLKSLELVQGRLATFYDSFLAFRHGPKSIVNAETLIVFLISPELRTQKYEVDLVREIYTDGKCLATLALTSTKIDQVANNTSFMLNLATTNLPKVLTAVAYLVVLQILALHASIAEGNAPDDPCPDGAVNRVVQGVTIYKL